MGRNFVEALGKVMRSLEATKAGFWTAPDDDGWVSDVLDRLRTPPRGASMTSSWHCGWARASSR